MVSLEVLVFTDNIFHFIFGYGFLVFGFYGADEIKSYGIGMKQQLCYQSKYEMNK